MKKILSFNLNMSVEQSKRRCFLTLIFMVKSVFKNLLIFENYRGFSNRPMGLTEIRNVVVTHP